MELTDTYDKNFRPPNDLFKYFDILNGAKLHLILTICEYLQILLVIIYFMTQKYIGAYFLLFLILLVFEICSLVDLHGNKEYKDISTIPFIDFKILTYNYNYNKYCKKQHKEYLEQKYDYLFNEKEDIK